MAVIGIDFGSSYSSASWINPKTGKAEPIVFRDNNVKLPSVMLFNNGGFLCGYQAESYLDEVNKLPAEYRITMMQDFVPCLKSALSTTETEYFGGKEYSYTDLLTTFFEYMVGLAQQHCGNDYKITDVVFSHPVDFTEAKINMMKKAFENIGLKVDKEQFEPVAAILGHSQRHAIKEGEGILVFDYGGGTIDVAYIRKSSGKLRVSAQPRGDSHCGGNDLDYLIYEHFRNKIKHEFGGYDITHQGAVDFAILNICKKLKESFSGKNDVYSIPGMIVANGKMNFYNFSLSREAFNNIIYAKVNDAVSIAKMVAKDVKANGYKVDSILLIGGSSRLTLVSELLSEVFPGAKLETGGERDIVVALGNIMSEAVEKPRERKVGISLISASATGKVDVREPMSYSELDKYIKYNSAALKTQDLYLTYTTAKDYVGSMKLKYSHRLKCRIMHETHLMAYAVPPAKDDQTLRLKRGDESVDFSIAKVGKGYLWEILGYGNTPLNELGKVDRVINVDGNEAELFTKAVENFQGKMKINGIADNVILDAFPFDVNIAILDGGKKFISGGLIVPHESTLPLKRAEVYACGKNRTIVARIGDESVVICSKYSAEEVTVWIDIDNKDNMKFRIEDGPEANLGEIIFKGYQFKPKPVSGWREPNTSASAETVRQPKPQPQKPKVTQPHEQENPELRVKVEKASETEKQKAILRRIKSNMVLVQGGTFMMGHGIKPHVSLLRKLWDGGNLPSYVPAHKVKVDSFYISKYEVTQEEWLAFMGKFPAYRTKKIKGEPFIKDFPMNDVTWKNCQEFITRLNEFSHLTFRLPTEAEWEYAARGGNKSKGYEYAGTNTRITIDAPHAIGQGTPNELGLYDMSDNLFEWCQDWYKAYYSPEFQTNPQGPTDGSWKVLRGGRRVYDRNYQRPNRLMEVTSPFWQYCGFRLVLTSL